MGTEANIGGEIKPLIFRVLHGDALEVTGGPHGSTGRVYRGEGREPSE